MALAVGAALLVLALGPRPWAGRAISATLAAIWLWVAWAFLLERYTPINWAAEYFAAVFLLHAATFLGFGAMTDQIRFGPVSRRAKAVGLGVALYALAVHPLLPLVLGRNWREAEIFGLAPDPTAIFTLGLLALAQRAPWPLFVLPSLWCAVSGLTLWAMKSPEALLPPLLAVAAVAAARKRD